MAVDIEKYRARVRQCAEGLCFENYGLAGCSLYWWSSLLLCPGEHESSDHYGVSNCSVHRSAFLLYHSLCPGECQFLQMMGWLAALFMNKVPYFCVPENINILITIGCQVLCSSFKSPTFVSRRVSVFWGLWDGWLFCSAVPVSSALLPQQCWAVWSDHLHLRGCDSGGGHLCGFQHPHLSPSTCTGKLLLTVCSYSAVISPCANCHI